MMRRLPPRLRRRSSDGGGPNPTEADVTARLGRLPDIAVLRLQADGQQAVGGGDATVGSLGGRPVAGYVWGDLENYLSGQELFDRDAIVLRLAREVGSSDNHAYHVSAYDAATDQLVISYTVAPGPGDLFDLPAVAQGAEEEAPSPDQDAPRRSR